MQFLGNESTIPASPAAWWSACARSGFKTLAWIRSENCTFTSCRSPLFSKSIGCPLAVPFSCLQTCLLTYSFVLKKGLKKTPFGSNTEWEQNVSLAAKNISCVALFKYTVVRGRLEAYQHEMWGQQSHGHVSDDLLLLCGMAAAEGRTGHTVISRVSVQLSSS